MLGAINIMRNEKKKENLSLEKQEIRQRREMKGGPRLM